MTMKNSSMINGSVNGGGGNDDDPPPRPPLPLPLPLPLSVGVRDVEAMAMDQVSAPGFPNYAIMLCADRHGNIEGHWGTNPGQIGRASCRERVYVLV